MWLLGRVKRDPYLMMNVEILCVCVCVGTIFVFCTRDPLHEMLRMGTRASYTQQRRLKQDTETLEATGTPTAGQNSTASHTSLKSHRHT